VFRPPVCMLVVIILKRTVSCERASVQLRNETNARRGVYSRGNVGRRIVAALAGGEIGRCVAARHGAMLRGDVRCSRG